MNSKQWIEKADKYIMKTYGRYPLVPVRGEGCCLWDADGKGISIFSPGWRSTTSGTAIPRWSRRLQKQAGELIHCSNYYQIPQQIELAELLCSHSFADRAFFCNSRRRGERGGHQAGPQVQPGEVRRRTATRSSPPCPPSTAGPWRPSRPPARRRCSDSSTRSCTASSMSPSTMRRPCAAAVTAEHLRGHAGADPGRGWGRDPVRRVLPGGAARSATSTTCS